MFFLSIFIVTLITINGARSCLANPDVFERLMALQNKLERQELRIKTLENTVSTQENMIADLTDKVTTQEKQKMELKMKLKRNERTIKRSLKDLKLARLYTNTDATNTNSYNTEVSRKQGDGEIVYDRKRFVLDTLETVAFEATVPPGKTVQHNNIHDRIIFEEVSLNVGNGYNHGNGTFTAPVGGIYVFSTSVMMNGGNTQDLNMHVILEKNNAEIAGAFAYNQGAYEHSSVTASMNLQAGDTVAVTVERHNDITFYGDRLTSFTGFLLYAF